MRLRIWPVAFTLIAIAVVSLILTGWTIGNYRESHRTIRKFDIRLARVEPGEEIEQFAVTLDIDNSRSPLDIQIDSLSISILYRSRMIASTNWFPDDYVVPSGDVARESFSLESELFRDSLPGPEWERSDWSVRVRGRLTHRETEELFVVFFRSAVE